MKATLVYGLLFALTSSCTIGVVKARCLPLPYQLLLVQLITAFIIEVSSRYFIKNNMGLYNVYIVQEVTWLTLAGRLWLQRLLFRKLLIVGLLICLLIWVVNMRAINPISTFANKAFLSNCVLLTALYTGIMLQAAGRGSRLLGGALFWVCLAHILYFGCVIPFFSMYDYFTLVNPQLGRRLFRINSFVAVARYLLIAWALFRIKDDRSGQTVNE